MVWLFRALAALEEDPSSVPSMHVRQFTITSNSRRSDTLFWPPRVPTSTQTDRQTDRQADRQTDRQTLKDMYLGEKDIYKSPGK